jgi:tetraacyldisaccharide 4'-kinase
LGVGGTGKTPLVRALARALAARGHRPGIVSRGYGAPVRAPREVATDDDPRAVGDEPLLLAADGFPVVVAPDRVAAARELIARHPEVDVILADDGLQHYALGRDLELVVVDAQHGLGNRRLLPAGPLREPAARLAQADALVWSHLQGAGAAADARGHAGFARAADLPQFTLTLVPGAWQPLRPGIPVPPLAHLPRGSVHAVAGIGQPQRFFHLLRALGIDAVPHAFPDHHAFVPSDLAFPGARAILMTEKDAVKCGSFADARMLFLPLASSVDAALVQLIEDRIHGRQAA